MTPLPASDLPLGRRPGRLTASSAQAVTTLIVVLSVGAAVLLVLLLAVQTRIPLSDLTRDPLAIMGKKSAPHLGSLSNLGVLLWCMTASVCAFTGLRLAAGTVDRRAGVFLLVAAGFTAVLMLDDLFMLHENLTLRLPQGDIALFTLYGLLALGYILAFRRVLRRFGVLAPLLAVALLGVSVVADLGRLTAVMPGNWPWVVEDGSKFVGIVLWAAFHLRVSWIAALPETERAQKSR